MWSTDRRTTPVRDGQDGPEGSQAQAMANALDQSRAWGRWTADCGLRIADCGLRTADYMVSRCCAPPERRPSWLRLRCAVDMDCTCTGVLASPRVASVHAARSLVHLLLSRDGVTGVSEQGRRCIIEARGLASASSFESGPRGCRSCCHWVNLWTSRATTFVSCCHWRRTMSPGRAGASSERMRGSHRPCRAEIC